MHSKANQECRNCLYFELTGDPEADMGHVGQCRRYPPVQSLKLLTADEILYDNPAMWYLPAVNTFFWCGEWKEDLHAE